MMESISSDILGNIVVTIQQKVFVLCLVWSKVCHATVCIAVCCRTVDEQVH